MYGNYAVIFDMDGVLTDTEPIHYQSWVKMAKEIGKNFSKEFFKSTFGQQSVPITRKLVGTKVDDDSVKKWADLKENYFREMVKDKIIPLFEAERCAFKEFASGALLPIRKIAEEIFFVPPRIYVLSSIRSIVQNLSLCFRHYFIHSSMYSDNGIVVQRSN